MSALTDLFTALANKIRSKTGTQTTYTPAEMVQDGIDDVYDAGYAAGGGGVSPTSITPSDSNPAAMTNGSVYQANGSGYAIESNPSSLTPNNLMPSSISSGTIYKASGSGYAVASYTNIAPSDSSPVSLVENNVYRLPNGANGYAIENSPTAVTPSASGTAFTSGIKRMSSSGYAYSAKPTPSLQSKTSAPNVSTNKTVSPDSGYDGLSQVTITPLSHTGYSPSSSSYTSITMGTSQTIDLGANHDKRYVRVQATGPSGTKDNTGTPLTTNGDHTITGLSNYTGVKVKVNVPGATYDGDAAVGNVLYGKTFYSDSSTKKTGTMTNNGAVSPSALSAGGSYTIPAGYHNGSGVVSAKTLASQTGVDSGKTAIDASHVLNGYQGWVNGNKVSGTYVAPTGTSITPSDSSPAAMTSGTMYTPTKAGYAIESNPVSVTPTASGAQFSQGMVNMSDGGYAYTARPSKTVTTLWTNTSPSSNFSAQSVKLSASIENYDYIKVTARYSTSNTTEASTLFLASEMISAITASGNVNDRFSFGMRPASQTGSRSRLITVESLTWLAISTAYSPASTSTSNTYCIPTKIEGIKYNGIS